MKAAVVTPTTITARCSSCGLPCYGGRGGRLLDLRRGAALRLRGCTLMRFHVRRRTYFDSPLPAATPY